MHEQCQQQMSVVPGEVGSGLGSANHNPPLVQDSEHASVNDGTPVLAGEAEGAAVDSASPAPPSEHAEGKVLREKDTASCSDIQSVASKVACVTKCDKNRYLCRAKFFRLMKKGAAYAAALQYQRCIDIWSYVLEVCVARDTILGNNTIITAQALVRLYLDLHERHPDNQQAAFGAGGWGVQGGPFIEDLRFSDVMGTASLLTGQLCESQQLLSVRPVHVEQQDNFDRALKCLTHIFHLLIVTAKDSEQLELTRLLVSQAVHINPRSSRGDTLLHLASSRSNRICSRYFPEDIALVFPNLPVAKLLIECGSPVNANNNHNSTPLHYASFPTNFNTEVVQLLLDHGGHLDQQNSFGKQPLHLLAANPNSTIPLLRYTHPCAA